MAERFNRIIVELARAMIIARDVNKNLWHEAINYATYIQNKSFTHAIKGKLPMKVLLGKNLMSPIYMSLAAQYGCSMRAIS